MYTNTVAISIFTLFLLAGLIGLSYAETENVNGTENTSQSGNISVNETNQSYQDHMGGNNSGKTNSTDKAVSTGGIKIFMKDFKYQSGV